MVSLAHGPHRLRIRPLNAAAIRSGDGVGCDHRPIKLAHYPRHRSRAAARPIFRWPPCVAGKYSCALEDRPSTRLGLPFLGARDGNVVSWVIGIAVIIGVHVALWQLWPVLIFLWVTAAILWTDLERQKAVYELKWHRDGSWFDHRHEALEELRAEHDAYRRSARNNQSRAKWPPMSEWPGLGLCSRWPMP